MITLFRIVLVIAVMFVGLSAREVKVGIYQNPPKYFLNQANKPSGFFGELFEYIAREKSWDAVYVPCSWNECLEMTEQGDIDLMLDVAYNQERAQRFDFNREIILSNWVVLYTNRNIRVDSVMDLDGRRVALLKGSMQEKLLTEMAGKFGVAPRLVYVKSFEEAFEQTEEGVVDLCAVNELYGKEHKAHYQLNKSSLAFTPDSLHFVTKKGTNGELLQAVDETVRRLKGDKASFYYVMKKRWFSFSETPSGMPVLNSEETAWLKDHPAIRVGIHAKHPPIEYLDDDGKAKGISIRLFDLIGEKTGIRVTYVPADSFVDLAEMVDAKRVDLVASTADVSFFSGMDRILLDQPMPIAIFREESIPRISDPLELKGEKVAVLKESEFFGVLQTTYPGITFVPVENFDEAVDAVQNGTIGGFAGNQVIISHLLHEKGYTDIKVAVSTILKCEPSIGIRSDWPELTHILRKTLAAIPDTTKAAIRHEMIGIQHAARPDYSLVWKIGIGLSMVLGGMFFWNRRLQAEIRERQAAEAKLHETLQTLRETQSQLIQQSRLDSLSDLITNIAHHWRQPLNMLALYIGDLKEAERFNELNATYLEEFNDKSQKTIAKMSRMIDDFREFYIRREQWQRFDVKDAINKAVAMMEANFETIGAKVDVDIRSDAFVEGYPNEFTQVLLSILHNAKESISENGGEKKAGVILDKANDKTVRIEIFDNGGGIDEEKIDRIFEPYFTTKFKAMGVGASLYMAKMAVEKRMFGTIRAINREGGAVFVIELTAHEEFGGRTSRESEQRTDLNL